MLPRHNRLTKKDDFSLVKQKGKIIQSESFAFAYLSKDRQNPSRFGFVVSTKISKKAVERNRVKRMLRQIIKENLDSIKNGFDGIFLVRQSILKVEIPALSEEVKKILTNTQIRA